jgi:hypothetical protein
MPGGLAIAATNQSAIGLSWSPSADNVGVAGYHVYRNGSGVGTATATSYTDSPLTCSTTYTLGVEAYDAAGNSSTRASVSSATAACSSADPSGVAMPVGDLTGWRQIFTDNFATDVPLGSFPAAVSSKWGAYPSPWKDTSKNGSYWPEKGISVHGGEMDIWLHTETVNGVVQHIVQSPHPILPGKGLYQGQLYGRYAIRYYMQPVAGYKTAWLLWPDSDTWPRDGEIDFPEGDLTGNVYAFMHRQNGTTGSDQDGYSTNVPEAGAWHTAVIEWGPAHCRFYLDGTLIGDSTSRIPNTPMHWVIQTETQLSGGAPANTAAGHVYIDWVAVYAPA